LAEENSYSGAGVPPEVWAQDVLSADSDYADAWRILARVAIRNNKVDDVFQYYKQAIDAEPTYLYAYVSRALCYLECKQDAKSALADLNTALKLDPNDPEVYDGFTDFAMDVGDLNAAIGYTKHLLQLNPYAVTAIFNQAIAYDRSGQYD